MNARARRHHDPDHHRPDHVSAADGRGEAELRSREGLRAGLAARALRVRHRRPAPATDAKDFKQLVAWLKANPAKASFGVPSNGTIPHFTGSRLEQVLGIPMTRVPYRGGAPIVKDLIGGHLPFAVITLSDAIPQHQAGARAHPRGEQREALAVPARGADAEARAASISSPTPGTACGCRPAARRISRRRLSAAVATVLGKPRGEGEAAGDRPHSGRQHAGSD